MLPLIDDVVEVFEGDDVDEYDYDIQMYLSFSSF